jgi:hypothetical protein
MNLPGSYQVGINAKLLQQYPLWRFAPHPEWVTPRGTTLLGAPQGGERTRSKGNILYWRRSHDAVGGRVEGRQWELASAPCRVRLQHF